MLYSINLFRFLKPPNSELVGNTSLLQSELNYIGKIVEDGICERLQVAGKQAPTEANFLSPHLSPGDSLVFKDKDSNKDGTIIALLNDIDPSGRLAFEHFENPNSGMRSRVNYHYIRDPDE